MRARGKSSAGRLLITVSFVLALAAALVGTAGAQLQLAGVPLTTNPAQDLRAAFSPDGQSIAFQSSRSGSYDILLMDLDGGNQRFLMEDAPDDRRPAWSPDGNWIAFDSDRSGNREIWVVDTSGANLTQITNSPGQETFPSFSPDGTQIAYFLYEGGLLDLWVVDVGGVLGGGEMPEPRRVTTGLANERNNQCTFACHSPGWSPDGTRLAYTGQNNTQIWVVGLDGSNPHVVSGGGAIEHFPQFTSDGRIVFLSERVTDNREPVSDVWIMDVDGGNAGLLFDAIPHGGPLEFLDESSTVVFHSPRTGNFDIYTTVLGQESTVVTPQAQITVESFDPAASQPTAAAVQPTAAAPQPTAPPAETEPATGLMGIGLGVVGLALLAGGGAVYYLLRRRRAA